MSDLLQVIWDIIRFSSGGEVDFIQLSKKWIGSIENACDSLLKIKNLNEISKDDWKKYEFFSSIDMAISYLGEAMKIMDQIREDGTYKKLSYTNQRTFEEYLLCYGGIKGTLKEAEKLFNTNVSEDISLGFNLIKKSYINLRSKAVKIRNEIIRQNTSKVRDENLLQQAELEDIRRKHAK